MLIVLIMMSYYGFYSINISIAFGVTYASFKLKTVWKFPFIVILGSTRSSDLTTRSIIFNSGISKIMCSFDSEISPLKVFLNG